MRSTSRNRWLVVVAVGAAAALAVAGLFVLVGDNDEPESETASATATTDGAASTTVASAEPATAAEGVAMGFVDAYGAFDADRALAYLPEEALATGHTPVIGAWESPDRFRRELRLLAASGFKQMVTGCDEQDVTDLGVSVRCDFDLHEIRSDEIGFGPYTGNYWQLTVRDGKVTSAASSWPFLANGSSKEMWEPFRQWVESVYPEDAAVMYLGPSVGQGPAITDESIRLWEQRSREWVAVVKAGS
jgi:hypothetical protein